MHRTGEHARFSEVTPTSYHAPSWQVMPRPAGDNGRCAMQSTATNLKRDTFRHFGSMAIPKSSKI